MKYLTSSLFGILASVFIILGSGCGLQNKVLYFPSSRVPPKEILRGVQLAYWPNLKNYRGFIGTQRDSYPKGTVVVFHGNGGIAAQRRVFCQILAPLGYRVILAEYPAYGGRSGLIGEKAFVKDALETLQIAFLQYGSPFYVVGESLGCGVAAAAVAKSSVDIKGVLLLTPWDSLAAVAHSKLPFLPMSLLLTDTYDNIANMKEFPNKIAIIGAEQDSVIPVIHAENLFDSLPSTKKHMWIVEGAKHNDINFQIGIPLWERIFKFLSS